MFEKIKEVFSQIIPAASRLQRMASLGQVKALVPSNAHYVTIVDMVVLKGRMKVTGYQYNSPLMSHRSVENPQIMPPTLAYMVHDGSSLLFIDSDGRTILNVPIQDIDNLESRVRIMGNPPISSEPSGFVCNIRDGRTILLGMTPREVETDSTTTYRTVLSPTDITGGWAEELSAYGIVTEY